MAVTYVTAFLDLKEDRSKDKSADQCFQHFQTLVDADIPIVLFISKQFLDRVQHIHSPNTRIIPFELEDLETYAETIDAELPPNRTAHHDTKHFMILMNAKIEFVKRAIDANPFRSEHYAWIDFSIAHVFRRKTESLTFLNMMSKSTLKPCVLFPGCWEKGTGYPYVYETIHWRFCGGFFLGDIPSLVEMYNLYRTKYTHILQSRNRLLWEVNIWSILEHEYGWNPTWYHANHDDSILRFPTDCFKVFASLTTIPSRIHTSCRNTIDSLLPQVDHIYLSLAKYYTRFSKGIEIPRFFFDEPYRSKVTILIGEDKGPATKYLGALDCIQHTWVFFCDDDQEYSNGLVPNMMRCIDSMNVYQNRYSIIQNTSSGGLIHGYVGNLAHVECLRMLDSFPLPECAYHVDDQWMSIYYFLNNISIKPTGIEEYSDIYKSLDNNHELIGADSLASLGTRSDRVQQLEAYFQVKFLARCDMKKVEASE